ncbi:cardiolipin synthase [Abyssisolibacter fermentans]|uniref:cardiolipin synthase n=1 Tax=Abyssisolibacter fermentans TaxID=1766203 RepID=UPI0009E874DE|nr:cardiolipin synthase [Abyssisolibacter fermentans]
MNIFASSVSILMFLNIVLAFAVIFLERKNPASAWAWIMVLLFVPGVGFILYLLFSQNIAKKKIFRFNKFEKENLKNLINSEIELLRNNNIEFKDNLMYEYKDMIYMNLVDNYSLFTQNNNIEVYTDGKVKFDNLLKAINEAKEHIHIQYYIIKNDGLSKKILYALIKRAKEGVEVRLLYDAMGSRLISRKLLKKLDEAGGKTVAFFPSKIPYVNLRVNYRNHRKIVIIDGKYGFVGGFNIGDEYLGLNKRLGYWRDTHLKIIGEAVYSLQSRFLEDWRYASKEKFDNLSKYFKNADHKGDAGIQIVSSGPDSEQEQIKYAYLKMIYSAKKSLYIQTPYFIPDGSFLEALRIASLSGVDVRIMIPDKPDHMFVYWATYSYIGELLKAGVKAYVYNKGFLHAKTFVVDGKICSVGTANVDIRSFKLNFEVNALIYDREVSENLISVFKDDIKNSSEITKELYKNRSKIIKIKEAISRLLSPIL